MFEIGESFEAVDRMGSKIRATIIEAEPAPSDDYVNRYHIHVFERWQFKQWRKDDVKWWIEEEWFNQRKVKAYDQGRNE